MHLSRGDVDELRRYHLEARRHGEKILACLVCAGPLHPRRRCFGTGDLLDTFAHDPGAHETCVLARSGEGPRHEMLKTVICKTADRVAGFSADVEVRGDGIDPDSGCPPVVDVVATNQADRSRHGWEVQLSPQTDALVYRRQEVRLSYLNQCSWETAGGERPVWADKVPWLGLELDDQTWRVTGGLVARRDFPDGTIEWVPAAEPEPLTRVVGDQVRPSQRRLTWVGDIGLGWARLADVPGTGVIKVRKPGPAEALHSPTEICDRPRVDAGPAPDRVALGAVLRERSTSGAGEVLSERRSPAPGVDWEHTRIDWEHGGRLVARDVAVEPSASPTWRPRPNLPDLVPISESEHRRATSGRRLVAAPFRRALLQGGTCGCTG